MPKSTRYALIACTALFFTLSAWSFGAPIGEGGDGDHHLSSIWCGWGESEGMCENRGDFGKGYVATVPYMFQMCNGRPSEDVTTCQYVTTELKPDNLQTLRTSGPQTRNLYYSLMRIFASENPKSWAFLGVMSSWAFLHSALTCTSSQRRRRIGSDWVSRSLQDPHAEP
jgi:hypothetical protein